MIIVKSLVRIGANLLGCGRKWWGVKIRSEGVVLVHEYHHRNVLYALLTHLQYSAQWIAIANFSVTSFMGIPEF